MDGSDADDVIDAADGERERLSRLARDAVEWFLDEGRIGTLIPRDDAIDAISDYLDCDAETANQVVGSLVSDRVDPVQQVRSQGDRYVGAVEYTVFEDAGAYGYVDYDDRLGRRKRVICARCVEMHDLDEHIAHATQGDGSADDDASWDDLTNLVTAHYADAHSRGPDDVEPGAALVSGTTIGGNTAWSAGNDGAGSGLDADTVDGEQADDLGGGQLIQQDRQGNALITTSDTVLDNSFQLAPQTNTEFGFINQTVQTTPGNQVSASTTLSGGPTFTEVKMVANRNTAAVEAWRLYWDFYSGTNKIDSGSFTYGDQTTTFTTAVNTTSLRMRLAANNIQDSNTGGTMIGTIEGFYQDAASGTRVLTDNPSQTLSPVWSAHSINNPGNGAWNQNRKLNGSPVTPDDRLYSELTTGDTFTNTVSYSNVTTTTVFQDPADLYGGSFV